MSFTSTSESIVKEISIKASAERVFAALVDPSQRVRWWGSAYVSGAEMDSDLRPGGKWTMRGTRGDHQPFSFGGEYRIVDRPKVLAFTLLPTWMPGSPETLVRFDLEERDGVTLVRLTHSGLTKEMIAQGFQGWDQILAALQGHVERSSPDRDDKG